MEIMYRYATNKMVHDLKLKMEDLVNGDYEKLRGGSGCS